MFNSFQDFWNWGNGILASLCWALLTLVLFWVAGRVLYRTVVPALQRRLTLEKHPLPYQLLRGFSRPLAAYLRVAGLCCALLILCTHLENEALPKAMLQLFYYLPPFLYKALRVGAVLACAWGLIASSDISTILLNNAHNRLDIHMSKSVSRFLAAVSNVIVAVVAATIILSEFSIDINGLVAGLGLGGLTIALAAKDSASNFFGGLVLVMEKPFEIGDWIVCEDVEGSVEDINLRTTKIRTSAGSLTVMPNATLASAPITNWGGGMEKRRADFILNMRYSTPNAQMEAFIRQARGMLEKDPDIISDSVIVRLAELGESSLNVRVIFYTSNPAFADHLRVRERVNYALMELARQNGVDFTFPSRVVYLQDASPHGAGQAGDSRKKPASPQ